MNIFYNVMKKNTSSLIKHLFLAFLLLLAVSLPPINADSTDWVNELGMSFLDTMMFSKSATVDNNTLKAVSELNESCDRFSNPECLISRMDEYVREKIEYKETTGLPSFHEVMEKEEARCVGQAVVFASLVESAGMEAYYAYQPRHICVVWRSDGETGAWNCLDSEEIMFTSPVTVSD